MLNLYKASIDGVDFFVENALTHGGRRQKEFELIGTDRRQVQDLGKYLKKFKVVGYIQFTTGKSSDYFASKNNLINVLEKQGVRKLSHPFFGDQNVTTGIYEIEESNKTLGYAKITFDAIAVSDLANIPMPNTADNPNKNSVKNKANQTMGEIAKNSTNDFKKLANELQKLYLQAREKFIQALNAIRTYLAPYLDDIKFLTNLITEIEKNIQFIQVMLSNPELFFNFVFTYISQFDGLYQNAMGMFQGLNDLLVFSQTLKNDPPYVSTINTQLLDNNANVIADSLGKTALAMQNSVITEITFTTSEDIQKIRTVLQDNINKLGNDPVFTDLNNETAQYLDKQAKNVISTRQINLNTNVIPLSVLCYKVYGSLDNFDILKDINNIEDVENITGVVNVVVNE